VVVLDPLDLELAVRADHPQLRAQPGRQTVRGQGGLARRLARVDSDDDDTHGLLLWSAISMRSIHAHRRASPAAFSAGWQKAVSAHRRRVMLLMHLP